MADYLTAASPLFCPHLLCPAIPEDIILVLVGGRCKSPLYSKLASTTVAVSGPRLVFKRAELSPTAWDKVIIID